MWPAEGAVGESVIEHFHRHGIRWIASDQGVLKRSGKWGYEADRPELLARAWRAGSDDPAQCVSIFFRDTELSDTIGFLYGKLDPQQAAADFVTRLKKGFMPAGDEERIVSVILDGENAWGSYRQAGRPFFEALYSRLGTDPDICTVTFSEWLDGDPARGIAPHPLREQPRVYELAHASWIDENGSRPGNDLGTWIGEPEENAAWDLLRETREAFKAGGITAQTHPQAFEALYAAEGSDWFWWYGDDQQCDAEDIFDDLFRHHLRCAYKLAGLKPPRELDEHIVPHVVPWSFLDQKRTIQPGDRLRFKTGCPGVLIWGVNDWQEVEEIELEPSGGVMAGKNIYSVTLPSAGDTVHSIELQFHCRCEPVCHCAPDDLCCNGRKYQVLIQRPRARRRGGFRSPRA
jgi:alpha-amylase/alpha-mannosidase (GH57 family)